MPYAVQGKRGSGQWKTIPREENLTQGQAIQRMDVYRKLINDAVFRIIRVVKP